MERYDQEYRRNYDNWQDNDNRRNRNSNSSNDKFENYQSRYQNRGNYYGMPDSDYEYRNVKSTEGSFYGRNTPGPVGGYGASSYSSSSQSSGNRHQPDQWDTRWNQEQERNYNTGSSNRHQDDDDHYRYGDPNPYMGNNRNGGYERTRGTGWRSESDTYEGTGYGKDRYSRQDNSYTTKGEGRRYSSFGRDEEENYGHEMSGGLDHRHIDRGEHDRSRWENNYTPERHYGSSANDQHRDQRRKWQNVSDKYSRHNDSDMFDYTDDNYPSNSRYASSRHRSGPNWSADSAASDYSQSDLRG